MDITMVSGNIRLKGRELLEKYSISMYRVAKDSDINYHTIHKYFTNDLQRLSSKVLYGILTNGLGLSIEEAKNLRLGDVFEFVPDDEG